MQDRSLCKISRGDPERCEVGVPKAAKARVGKRMESRLRTPVFYKAHVKILSGTSLPVRWLIWRSSNLIHQASPLRTEMTHTSSCSVENAAKLLFPNQAVSFVG
jgi:hypothetical protein